MALSLLSKTNAILTSQFNSVPTSASLLHFIKMGHCCHSIFAIWWWSIDICYVSILHQHPFITLLFRHNFLFLLLLVLCGILHLLGEANQFPGYSDESPQIFQRYFKTSQEKRLPQFHFRDGSATAFRRSIEYLKEKITMRYSMYKNLIWLISWKKMCVWSYFDKIWIFWFDTFKK